jgi:hypothetical protein
VPRALESANTTQHLQYMRCCHDLPETVSHTAIRADAYVCCQMVLTCFLSSDTDDIPTGTINYY